MHRVVIAGLKARFARLLLSTFAVVLGVAFVTGSLVLADAVTAGLRAEVAMATRGVDASVSSRRAPITPENLQAARQVAGVAAAEGRTSAKTPLLDAEGKATDASATALPADEQLRPFELAGGRYPQRPDEIALEQLIAAKYILGQQINVLSQDGGTRSFTLVGAFSRPGNNLGGAQVVLLPETLATFGAGQDYHEIVVRAASGVTQQELAGALAQALPGLTVETGSQNARRLLTETAPQSGDFTGFFTAFAVLALIVAAMVIHNSFTILVAQRTRELALLRCIGAGKGQVLRGVLAEAVFVGLIAAVIGLAGGLGIAALGQVVIGADAVYAPLTARTVAAAFAVGVLVTVVAALLPARAATRVAPVAALRSPGDGRDSIGRLRIAVAIGLGLAGVATAVLGVHIGAQDGALVVMVGTAVMLGAVLAVGPVLVGPVVGLLSRLLAGVPARLAAANAEQNPRRTAASAATLTIGLAVVSLVTTIAASVETTTDRALDKQFSVDYTVTSASYDRPLSTELADSLAAVAQVETVAPRQSFNAVLNGSGAWLTAVRGDAVGNLIRPDVLSGRMDSLGPGEIAVSKQLAESTGFAAGQTVRATDTERTAAPKAVELRVIAVFDGESGPGNDLGLGMVDLSTMAALGLSGSDSTLLVKLKPDVNRAEADAAVRAVVAAAPLARISSIADVKAQASQSIRDLLVLMWALIGLAVIIALAGIANTLSLSVLERTRESALLRALGLTIGGLRATLVIESVFVATLGAALGLLLGIGSAWLFTLAAPMTFALPLGQIGVLLLAALMAAPLAALLPAHRATSGRRTSLVDPL